MFSYLSELPMRKIVCRIPRRGLEGKLYQINIQDNDRISVTADTVRNHYFFQVTGWALYRYQSL